MCFIFKIKFPRMQSFKLRQKLVFLKLLFPVYKLVCYTFQKLPQLWKRPSALDSLPKTT